MIRELRILPPLAIARFGAAPTPMDNYDATVDPERPLGYRILRPAETLEVDEATGGIRRSFVPARVTFTENGLVRPVAPFLEVWALTDDDVLEPLTPDLLTGDQASIGDVRWRVEVANLKVFRRTDLDADKVEASQRRHRRPRRAPAARHLPELLAGQVDQLRLGPLHPARPTPIPRSGCASRPAPGFVYGASTHAASRRPARRPERPRQSSTTRAEPGHLAGLHRRATRPGRRPRPGNIYAGRQVGQDWVSSGYLDDGCDGLVRVLAQRRRPDPDRLRPGRGRTARVRPGRPADPHRRRRAGTGAVRARPSRPTRRGSSRPRRSSAARSRPYA